MLLQGAEFGHGVVAGFGGAGGEIFFLHEIDVGESGGAGDGIASEGGEMVAGFEGCGNFRARGEGAEGESVGDAFGGDQNVGDDSVVLDGKHFAGTGEAGLDFVGDEKDVVLVEDFLYLFEIVWRRHDDAALAHDWLGDERGYVAGSGEADYVVDGFGALASAFFGVVAPLRTVGVGCGGEGDAGSVGASAFFAALVASDAKGAPAASVKAGVERDVFVLAGVEARQLHGTFNGFGSAVAEEGLGQALRGHVGNLFGKISDRLYVVDIRRAVDQLVHLGLSGGD